MWARGIHEISIDSVFYLRMVSILNHKMCVTEWRFISCRSGVDLLLIIEMIIQKYRHGLKLFAVLLWPI